MNGNFRDRAGTPHEEVATIAFTPYTVRPDLTSEREVQRALEREYPTILRNAGIGGTVIVHFFIDEEGFVQRTLVAQSSGHTPLDEAALRVPTCSSSRRRSTWTRSCPWGSRFRLRSRRAS